MGKGKLFKAAATIAAIGGVCYVFRDKIKNSTVYQSLDMDDKVEKVKHTIKEKMPAKEETADRDYFSLDDAVDNTDTNAEAATVAESVSDVTAKVDDLLSDIPSTSEDTAPEETIAEEAATEDTSTEDTSTEDVAKEEESPILYENEGLSDVSEDLDVIEEQDKLDL